MRTLFEITYDNWKTICTSYYSLNSKYLKTSLQLFPFTKLSNKDKELLVSESFFNQYIKNGCIFLHDENIIVTDNFLLKSDDSFRSSTLISPLLFLIVQTIGKQIYDNFSYIRNNYISVYYAGNYETNNMHYKKQYDCFYKEINVEKENFNYFIKTDIRDFFSNINLDSLIRKIENSSKEFSPQFYFIFKELLSYCGRGKFPCLEHSISSSYLASIIYLEESDNNLISYLKEIPNISSFRLYRYVDDLYILLNLKEASDESLNIIYSQIIYSYSSVLKKDDLSLNLQKCKYGKTRQLNEELKKSLYDESFHQENFEIFALYKTQISDFFDYLKDNRKNLTPEIYRHYLKEFLTIPDIEFSPNEIFNSFVYKDYEKDETQIMTSNLKEIIQDNYSVIKMDPKMLTILVSKTKDENLLKGLIKYLYQIHEIRKWDDYHTAIAITYLIQKSFVNEKLIDYLKVDVPDLSKYITNNCNNSFINNIVNKNSKIFISLISEDWKTCYLYVMYQISKSKNDYYSAYAYFKTFFDRSSALFDYLEIKQKRPHLKQPRFESFYRENNLIDFYKYIKGSEEIISKAHILRNQNPLNHASSDLLDGQYTKKDLYDSINKMRYLLIMYLNLRDILSKIQSQ